MTKRKLGVWGGLAGFVVGLTYSSCQRQGPEVTYTGAVAGILFEHCVHCHHPGGAGPFSLLNYRQAARKSKTIAKVTRERYMPPWPASRSYTRFLHEPTITNREIDKLQQWARQGVPYGDSALLPDVPEPRTRFVTRPPDMQVGYPLRISVPGDNRDRFFALKIPVTLDSSHYLRAIEYVPGNHQLVHHMNGHLVNFDPEKKESMHEGQYMVEHDSIPPRSLAYQLGFQQDDGSFPTMTPSVVNYLPGVGGTLYPEGLGGWELSRKFALYINDLHFGPTPVPASDSGYFNLYFMDHPPRRPLQELHLGTLGIAPVQPPLEIPPGEVVDFEIHYRVPQKISVLTVNPHMHLLGRSFKAYALTPGGDTLRLIHIPQWDFRWQYFYTYPRPVILPQGSEIRVEARMDNSAENEYNPYDPPRWVREREGSMRTTDEMLQFFITYLPYQPGDEELSLKVNDSKHTP